MTTLREAALRVALAEPVQQGCDHCNHPLYAAIKCRVCGRVTEPVQEPVAWSHNLIDNIITHRPADIDRHPDRWTPLYTMPPQRKPEPVQEPVAWIEHEWAGTGLRKLHFEKRDPTVRDEVVNPVWTPLYAFPPQRKPLTEEAIEVLEAKYAPPVHPNFSENDDWLAFARAIERAHGIGGEG